MRSGTLKSEGGAAFGIWGETAVGLLFCARESCPPRKGTHRSNPRKSALERLEYRSCFVTFRGKPYLNRSLVRIIQESRMMFATLQARMSHISCRVCAPSHDIFRQDRKRRAKVLLFQRR